MNYLCENLLGIVLRDLEISNLIKLDLSYKPEIYDFIYNFGVGSCMEKIEELANYFGKKFDILNITNECYPLLIFHELDTENYPYCNFRITIKIRQNGNEKSYDKLYNSFDDSSYIYYLNTECRAHPHLSFPHGFIRLVRTSDGSTQLDKESTIILPPSNRFFQFCDIYHKLPENEEKEEPMKFHKQKIKREKHRNKCKDKYRKKTKNWKKR